MDLYEIASRVATPEYVAAKVAKYELAIMGDQIEIAVALGVLAVCATVALVVAKKVDDEDARFFTNLIAGLVSFIAAWTLLFSALGVGSHTQNLAAWRNDPVTEVVAKLADIVS